MQVPVDTPDRAKVEEFQRKHKIALLTMLFTDLVGSTKIKQTLGERAAIALIERHDEIIRTMLRQFPEAEEISTAGDSFFCVFAKPSDAVQFALLIQHRLLAVSVEVGHQLAVRIGIHVGEVFVQQRSESLRDFFGLQIDTTSRIQSLAGADQILMSRFAFDNARQILRGHESTEIGELSWLNHGTYELAGVDDPVEVCEVGETNHARLKPPEDGAKARRTVTPNIEPVLGWRPAAGQRVPRTQWLLERPLGEGGFGEVWVARHETLKYRRVIKFCFKADRVRSLRREVTLFRILRDRVGEHPGIVGVHDVFFDEPPFYLVMDYVDGANLAEWTNTQPSLFQSLATRLEIIQRVAEALHAAHEAGIIHRDIKPSNILIRAEGSVLEEVKLTDFGIGQVMSAEALAGITHAGFTNTVLSTGSGTGTPLYMAPELLAGKPASSQSDIYGLGVLLYQAVVGDFHRPLATDWADEVTDPLLRADIRRCVAGDPSKRFRNANEIAANLLSLDQRHTTWESEVAAAAARERAAYRRGILRAAGIGAGISAFIAVLGLYAFRQSKLAGIHANSEAAAKAEVSRHLNNILLDRAEDLFEKKDVGGALAHLAAALRRDPDNKDIAERLLAALRDRDWAQPKGPAVELDGPIQGIEFSADGKSLLACTHSLAYVIDTEKGQIAAGPIKASFSFSSFADLSGNFSSDGKRIVLYSVDAQVFDAASGKPITPPLVHPNRKLVTGEKSYPRAIFSPNGEMLATVSTDTALAIWSLDNPEPIPVLIRRRSKPAAFCFSPDSQLLALACDAELLVWSISDQKIICEGRNDDEAAIDSLWFTPDSSKIITGGGTPRQWEIAPAPISTGKRLETSILVNSAYKYETAPLVRSTGDDLVERSAHISVTEDSVRAYNESGEAIGIPLGVPPAVTVGAVDNTAAQIALGSRNGSLRLWAVRPTRSIPLILSEGGSLHRITVDGDSQRALFSMAEGYIQMWDLQRGVPLGQRMAHLGLVSGAWFNADGSRIASGSHDGTARVWDAAQQSPVSPVLICRNSVGQTKLSPDGRYLANVVAGSGVDLWDTSSWKRVADGFSELSGFIFFSSNNRRLVCTDGPGVRLLEIGSWRSLPSAVAHSLNIFSVQMSPDSSNFITGGRDSASRVWSTEDGRPVTPWLYHKGELVSGDITSDNRFAVTGAADQTAQVWSIPDGLPVGRPSKHDSWVSAGFVGDGRRYITASGNQTMRVWSIATGRPLSDELPIPAIAPYERAFYRCGKNDFLFGGSDSYAALWELPEVAQIAPEWFPAFAEGIGGRFLDEKGALQSVNVESLHTVIQQIQSLTSDDIFTRTAKWILDSRTERSISPLSKVSQRDYIQRAERLELHRQVENARSLDPRNGKLLARAALDAMGSNFDAEEKDKADWEWQVAKALSLTPDAAKTHMADAALRFRLHETQAALQASEQATRLDSGDPHAWCQRGVLLVLANKPAEAVLAFDQSLSLLNSQGAPNWLKRGILHRRSEALTLCGRHIDASLDFARAWQFPLRSSDSDSTAIDLTTVFTNRLDQPVVRDDPGDVFEGLQPGVPLLNTIRYDVRGIVQLGGSSEMARMDDSASVKGPPIDGRIEIWPGEMPDHRHPLLVSIPMNASVKKLHFLHGTRDTIAAVGTEVAAYVVRYSDGTTLDVPLLLGHNIGDRFQDEGSRNSVEVAWRGSNQKARAIGKDLVLFHMNWENPKPAVGINSIDFISREAGAAPFLVSITAE